MIEEELDEEPVRGRNRLCRRRKRCVESSDDDSESDIEEVEGVHSGGGSGDDDDVDDDSSANEIDGEEAYVVERIVSHRTKNGSLYYLVKWLGFDVSQNSWEPAVGVKHAPEVIAAYNKSKSVSKSKRRSKKARL